MRAQGYLQGKARQSSQFISRLGTFQIGEYYSLGLIPIVSWSQVPRVVTLSFHYFLHFTSTLDKKRFIAKFSQKSEMFTVQINFIWVSKILSLVSNKAKKICSLVKKLPKCSLKAPCLPSYMFLHIKKATWTIGKFYKRIIMIYLLWQYFSETKQIIRTG